MGLDITAYRQLTKTTAAKLDESGYPEDYMTFFRARLVDSTESHFSGRTAGLEQDAVYSFSEQLPFRAGSYGGYNSWRNELAALAGYESAKHAWYNPPPDGSPFIELISFFDNEGTIGPIVAAKLANDFATFREKAEAHEQPTGWFFDRYCIWQQAFEMAADGGAVDFH